MLATSQVANPVTVVDDNWYLDSRASHHLTSELGSLSNTATYPGEEVTIRDGKSISIKHIGSVVIPTNHQPLRLCTILHTP